MVTSNNIKLRIPLGNGRRGRGDVENRFPRQLVSASHFPFRPTSIHTGGEIFHTHTHTHTHVKINPPPNLVPFHLAEEAGSLLVSTHKRVKSSWFVNCDENPRLPRSIDISLISVERKLPGLNFSFINFEDLPFWSSRGSCSTPLEPFSSRKGEESSLENSNHTRYRVVVENRWREREGKREGEKKVKKEIFPRDI